MTEITINDLLTKTLDELSEITDNVSPSADNEYVTKKIFAPLKALAAFHNMPGIKYLGYDFGDPFYDNLQLLLNAAVETDLIGNNVSLIVEIKKQLTTLNTTISLNRLNTLIRGNSKNEITITNTVSTLSHMHFKDLELILSDTNIYTNGFIENCKITSAGTIYLESANIFNSEFDVANLVINNLNVIKNCDIKASNSITFNIAYTNSKMYNCNVNKLPINQLNNSTNEFNVYIPNL